MSWSEFVDTEVIAYGKQMITVRDLLIATSIALITYVSIKMLRRSILRPNFIVDKIDQKRRISIFLIIKYFSWFLCVFLMLAALHVPITGLVFGSTAVLVGLGLGLQNIFKDLVSGLFLLFEGSVKIGDIIEADGVVGRVVEINLRNSHVLTRDDVTIIVPNSRFIGEKVVNWSHENESIRFTVDIGVAYGSDVEEVIDLLVEAMTENDKVLLKPVPFVRFTDFGDSSLKFECIFWSKETFQIDNVKSDIRRSIYKKLKNNNIKIPFPQRELHVDGEMINKVFETKPQKI